MDARNSFNESLIIRFLQKKASPEEIEQIQQWIDEDPENSRQFHDLQDLWNSIETDEILTDELLESRWEDIDNQLSASKEHGKLVKLRPYRFKSILRIAAVFVFGLVAGALLLKYSESAREKSLVYNEISTPLGSRSTLNLPDGSRIWLNAGSKIRYAAAFSNKEREVYLEGEAYFDVEHDRKRRFIVRTQDIEIRVHGTEFNIKSYPEDNSIETTLVEGTISVLQKSRNRRNDEEEILLQPNQRLILYKEKEVKQDTSLSEPREVKVKQVKRPDILAKGINPKQYISWKDGDLIIRSESMEDLAVKLERRYNVKIYFDDERVKHYTYSGTITDETLEQVMAAIKLASPIDYKIDERTVRINIKQEDF